MQVQANFLNGKENNDEVEDNNNAKEKESESKALNEKKRVLELLKDVEGCKSKSRSWMNKILTKNQFLDSMSKESKSIRNAN